MKRLLALSLPLALFAACGGGAKTCKDTGCSAGATCNTTTGLCEVPSVIGGGTATGGGSATGGGGGTGGGATGGGGGGGMVVDAGPIDPGDDGGTFVPGDICRVSIPVEFDGGVDADGGTSVTLTVDLATATDQYHGACSTSLSDSSGNDLVFKLTTTEPKGLVVTATNTATNSQNPVLALLASPCAAGLQVSCAENFGSADPEVLQVPRLPAGTWYVLLENYSSSSMPGTYDVRFELVDPVMGPPNDACATAETLTFTNDTVTVSGTTNNAFNDTAGAPLTCSTRSAQNPEVFYQFTLTQPQDVHVVVAPTSGSNLYAAVAVQAQCGGTGARNEFGCAASSSSADFTAKSLAAGTYFIVVDDNGFQAEPGDFTLTATLLPATPLPPNDNCSAPATLAPNMSQSVDANNARRDYPPSCRSFSQGGDVVYQFTLTQPQKVTLTTTTMNAGDAVLELRGGPCETGMSLGCVDETSTTAGETLSVPNLAAGTYFVFLSAYGTSAGQFGISLALEAPVPPPANDTCAMAAMLTPATSVNVDLSAATADYTLDCNAAAHDVVYTFTTTMPQRVTLTATSSSSADAVLELRSAACDPGTLVDCSDATGTTSPEVLSVPNLPAGTYWVVLSSPTASAQFGLALTLDAPVLPPMNETCMTVEAVTLTGGMATRTVDLTSAVDDFPEECAGLTGSGGDVVYSVSVPAGQTLTVTASSSIVDPVIYLRSPTCDVMTSLTCADDGGPGTTEVATSMNSGAAAATYFVIVKAYRVGGVVDVAFQAQ